jgi:hypothetical protein
MGEITLNKFKVIWEGKMKNRIIIFLCLTSVLFAEPLKRFEFDIESGLAIVGYNDVQIPKSTGTLISFSEELQTDPAFFARGRFTYYFNKSNLISILIAPLKLKAKGSVNREVIFEGESFAPNVTLNTVFRFNSYRISYQYLWFIGDNLHFGLGATAKIRDAAISIADSSHISEKTDIGFVPLIRFSLAWKVLDPLAFVLEGDALGAPQGRAEDVSLSIQSKINNGTSLKLGYRVLEGGSDVDAVYSFTWVNYIFMGVLLKF